MRGRLLGAALAMLCTSAVLADGGRMRIHRDAGPFLVTVFTAPDPLTAGPAEISVLVQERGSGEVVLDAVVEIELRPPGGSPLLRASAISATNRLLRAATVELPRPGDWDLDVRISRAGAAARASCVLPVGAPASRLAAIWPFLAAPPFGIALFALAGALRRRPK